MLWLWNFFLDRRQLSYVLITILVVAGAFSVFAIQKENMPQINIAEGIVTATLPGASAKDMETLVTNKLEAQISGISNIDTMTSHSGDGLSQIIVQFTAHANINQSIQDLRDAVARAEPDLPSDVTTPQVTKVNFSDQPVMQISVSGNRTAMELSTMGQTVSDELRNISGVSKVSVTGVPSREVDVIVSPERLAQYHLSLVNVISAISAANAALPAGSISMQGVNYNVNFKGGLTDPSQVNDIAVAVEHGSPVYLRDIANISNGLAPATTYSRVSVGGKPSAQAITLTVYKQSDASITAVTSAVRNKVDALKATTLAGMHVFIPPSTDQGVQLNKQLGELVHTGAITVLLVILVLLVTIGWREALVAALAIPLSFLIAFIGLYFTGNTLNFISLFALILAIGILVDSGIVVTEAIDARLKQYPTPVEAARGALHDYAWPLIAGTMATVAVFAPLFFISGIVGKFIAGIPYTLIFVLLASIFVALGIVPLIAVLFTKKTPNRLQDLQERYTERATEWYKGFLRGILEKRRTQTIFIWSLVGLMVATFILPSIGLLPVTFFPAANQDFVYINIQKPEGTTLAQTDLAVREVEELLYKDPNIASFQTTVGESSALSGQSTSGSNQANITVNLPSGHVLTSTQMVTELTKRLSVVTDATIQVLQASDGPPGGAPIQVQFEGKNLDQLITAADKGRQLLASMPHVINLTSSTQNNGTAFDLTINRAKATALGLNAALVGKTLRAAIHGTKATSIPEPDQDIPVVVKLGLNPNYTGPGDTAQTTIGAIKNLSLQGPSGAVLLGTVLNASLGESNSTISHLNKNRIETVSAYPDDTTTASAIVSAFQKRVSELHLPSDVQVSYGGETKSINQSFRDMFIAVIAGLVLMFVILVIAFNSIRYTLYLLSIVPLAMIGVLAGLTVTGQSLSFTSLLGVIGLGGVIINHAIILMDSMIVRLRNEPSHSLVDIVVESSATRLRPIVLTTITTVIGMIPLALSNPTWGPFAFTVMFGLAFAICLTLVLVPVLFFRAPHHKEITTAKPQ